MNTKDTIKSKIILSKILPKEIIDIIFEYHITYKEIFDNLLKKDIKIMHPEFFFLNNWTGPKLLSAFIVNGDYLEDSCHNVTDVTKMVQHLYGKKRNWGRRCNIVEFQKEYRGSYLALNYIGHETSVMLFIGDVVVMNYILTAPNSLQRMMYCNHEYYPSELFHGHITDFNYHKIICEIIDETIKKPPFVYLM